MANDIQLRDGTSNLDFALTSALTQDGAWSATMQFTATASGSVVTPSVGLDIQLHDATSQLDINFSGIPQVGASWSASFNVTGTADGFTCVITGIQNGTWSATFNISATADGTVFGATIKQASWFADFNFAFIADATVIPVITPPPEILGVDIEHFNISVMLAETEIGTEISQFVSSATWALAPSTTATYRISHSVIFDHVPRVLSRVEVGGIEYTKANSWVAVEATAGTWFHDRVTGFLYIHPKAGITLNLVIVQTWALIYGSNYLRHLNFECYPPLIVGGAQTFSISTKVGDQFFRLQNVSSGNIQFNDATGIFSALVGPHEFRGGKTVLRHSVDTLSGSQAYTNYDKVRTSYCGGISKSNNSIFEMHFRNNVNKFDVNALHLFYSAEADADYPDEESFPNLDTRFEGVPHPMIFGEFDDVSPSQARKDWNRIVAGVCVDIGEFKNNVWQKQQWKFSAQILDKHSGNKHGPELLDKLYLKRNDTIQRIGGNFWDVVAGSDNSTIIFKQGFGILDGDEVGAAMKGIADKAGKFTGSGTQGLKRIPDLIHFLSVAAGVRPSEIDIPSLTALRFAIPDWATPSTWNGDMKLIIKDQTTVQELLDGLQQSGGYIWQENVHGQFELSAISNKTNKNDLFLTDALISDFQEELTDEFIISRIIVEFRPSRTGDTVTFKKVKNKRSIVINGLTVLDNPAESILGIEREETVRCFYKQREDAKDRANYLYRIHRRGNRKASCLDFTGVTMPAKLGDRLILQKDFGLGVINEKPYWITELNKNNYTGSVRLGLMEIPQVA